MKALILLVSLGLGIAPAQTAPAPQAAASFPNLPEETVIATFPDGGTLTMGEFKRIYAAMPPNLQQMAMQSREEFLNEYSMLRDLTKIADEKKLDQQSPFKEALAFSRLMTMGQAAMVDANRSVNIENSDLDKRYAANREKYKQVRIKAIRVSFEPTEEKAKAKAERLTVQARRGADFVRLVRENSADADSRAKDGDFGVIRLNDSNDAVRLAVFALKQGEVSDPVRQQNGFYIFRAEEITYRPLSEVRNDVFGELQAEQYRVWADRISADSRVKNVNPAFLGHPQNPPKSQP
jgi:parvulin-like peptidyl-prolyl isomerase